MRQRSRNPTYLLASAVTSVSIVSSLVGACAVDSSSATPDVSAPQDAWVVALDASSGVSDSVVSDALDVGGRAPDSAAGSLPVPVGASVVFDGPVNTAGNSGLSEVITVEVPAGTGSLSVAITGQTGRSYALGSLVSPEGDVLVGAGWFTSPTNPGGAQLCLTCTNRIASSQGAHGALVPNNPSVTMSPGAWSLQIAAFDVVMGEFFEPPTVTPVADSAEVTIVLKDAPDPPKGWLDLNLFFTGAGGLDATNAPDDPRIVEAIADIEALYDQVGIGLGELRYADLDPQFQVIESLSGPDSDFERAASATAGAQPGINLIFVRDIIDGSSPLGGFGVILGVSGGIPGPIGVQGSARSAVFVDVELDDAAAGSSLGVTAAHEMGHYLGLFHSSEMPFVGIHDPLPDTPDNDAQNLMYFEGSATDGILTPQQGAVMRANPWVRHDAR